jgi:HPr kinase/phosphorylase
MITKDNLTLEALLEAVGRQSELTMISTSIKLHGKIDSPELNRPGLALAGFLDVFEPNRIQILGNTEMSYLKSLDPAERSRRLDATFSHPIPCLIVTNHPGKARSPRFSRPHLCTNHQSSWRPARRFRHGNPHHWG